MDINRIGDIEKVFVERRDWPRLAITELVDKAVIRASSGSLQSVPSVEIVNFSEAGAGVLLPAPMERGLRVTLELAGKNINDMDIQAEVRWIGKAPLSTGKYAAGLKFMNLDAHSQARLRDFMQTLRLRRKSTG